MGGMRFFTVILAALGLMVVTVSFLCLPSFFIRDNAVGPDGLAVAGMADYWEGKGHNLPVPTNMAIAFAGAKLLRVFGLLFLWLLTIVVELFVKNRRLAGGYHAIVLLAGILLSWFLLLAVILPFLPL